MEEPSKRRVRKPSIDKEKAKDRLRRGFFLFMVLLFVITGLGVGILSFWQATHPNKDTSKNQASCTFTSLPGQPTLPPPDAFKPDGDVTQLQTTDLEAGNGAAVKAGDCLTAKYYGTLASDGTKFDENFTQPQALKFQLGLGEVIPGWDQGLVGMKVGGTRRLVIPSDLAYGPQGACETYNATDATKCDKYAIEPNADLVFVVKVLSTQQ